VSDTVAAARRNSAAHWTAYFIEAWALGMFMVSAGVFTMLLESPVSPLHAAIPDAFLRRLLTGAAMGLTAIALIYSPWGRRSGAHMNPAVTLSFLRLGTIARNDAACYIVAQFIGGTLGVFGMLAVFGQAFSEPPVSYVATVPGSAGVGAAFMAEMGISALMIFVVLMVSSRMQLAPFTGLAAGLLVCLFISFEGPLSGMSINPARSFASALLGGIWTAFWIYLTAPVIGMQLGTAAFLAVRRPQSAPCAKLHHTSDERCIHCGYEPTQV